MRNMTQVDFFNLFDWYRRGRKPSNDQQIRSFCESNQPAKVLFFVSPGDFNSIEEFGLTSDKTAYIGKILKNNGYECAYLMREVLSSGSRVPKRVTVWPFGIITQRLHVRRLFLLIFRQYFWKPKKMAFAENLGHSPRSTIGEFLRSTLHNTLKELKPDVIFTIGATQELLRICQQLGIKVFEVMHGVFNEQEISRDFLVASNLKPDLFLTWQSCYSELLIKQGLKAFTLGHPNLKFSEPILRETNASPIYLITLEHSLNDSEDAFGVINKSLFAYAKYLSAEKRNVVFRIHPVVASQRKLFFQVENWLQSNFEKCLIESPLDVNLFESLSKADIQISYRSSTFFEAALLGVPTVLFDDLSLRQIPYELIAEKYVYQAEELNMTDLESIIDNILEPVDFLMREDTLISLMNSQLSS